MKPKDIAIAGGRDEVLNLLFKADLADLNPEDAMHAYAVLDTVSKAVEKRKAQMKAGMLEAAHEIGEIDDKGSKVVDLGDGKFTAQISRRVTWDPVKVLKLLEEAGLQPENGGSFEYKPDEKLLNSLVAAGLLDAKKAARCATVKEGYSLVIKKPESAARALASITKED